MKKIMILVGALMLVSLCAPLMAQSFTDVPTDHWAYTAIQDLANKGFVVGYPDGTFSGKRAVSRYEFAMAVSRIIASIQPAAPANVDLSGLDARIKNLENAPKTGGEVVAPDLTGYASKADVDKVKRLVDEFRDELATLGVDVDAIKRELADIRTRVEALEAKVALLPEISVDSHYYVRAAQTTKESDDVSGNPPADLNGNAISSSDNLLDSVRSLYDVNVTLKGKVGNGTVVGVFNAGNYLNATGVLAKGEEVTPWLIYGSVPFAMPVVKDSILTVGRLPLQLTPYTLRMVDPDVYFDNANTDSGDYPVLGAQLVGKVGPVAINLFGVQNNGANMPGMTGALGTPIQVLSSAPEGSSVLTAEAAQAEQVVNSIRQSAGVRATMGVPFGGNLGVNYILAGTSGILGTEGARELTELNIYGADLNLKPFNNIGLNASWTRSAWMTDGKVAKIGGETVTGNDAMDARVSVGFGCINAEVGYRQIGPNFTAPGYWGRIGAVRNPVDIQGPLATITVPVLSKLTLCAMGEFYQGTDKEQANYGGGTAADILNKDDKVAHYQADLKYAATKACSLDLGYEQVRFTPADSDQDNTQSFINLGISHEFNANASLKLMYQMLSSKSGDVEDKGGIATTQFSVKF